MAFADKYDFDLLVNEAEKKIAAELEQQLNVCRGDICRCSECVLDMAAMALNAVKPLYRVSLLGSLYAAEAINEESYAKGVHDAVAHSIEKVRKNPAHD
ncbi:MAG: late competence development ComFB family protein [Treponema sp.]|jgi:competence protein ComFB|nr:late competence development ComFB family protein [Treponema sp.]